MGSSCHTAACAGQVGIFCWVGQAARNAAAAAEFSIVTGFASSGTGILMTQPAFFWNLGGRGSLATSPDSYAGQRQPKTTSEGPSFARLCLMARFFLKDSQTFIYLNRLRFANETELEVFWELTMAASLQSKNKFTCSNGRRRSVLVSTTCLGSQETFNACQGKH